MNYLNLLAYFLILLWLGWRSKYAWKAWHAGHLEAKNLYFVGIGWVGIISIGIKYFY